MGVRNVERKSLFPVFLHLFFILMSACFVLPLIVVISASFTSEEWLNAGHGLSLIPHNFTTAAYQAVFSNAERIIRAYGVTIAQAFLGTAISCVIAGMAAYALSRSNFQFRKVLTGVIFFTMLFSAGMIPTYIIYSKYYGISNTFWIYILPGMAGGAWYTMVFRTFFKSLPESLFESAHLDGASELTIFFRIVVPLSTPVFASVGFMILVAKWNDYTAMFCPACAGAHFSSAAGATTRSVRTASSGRASRPSGTMHAIATAFCTAAGRVRPAIRRMRPTGKSCAQYPGNVVSGAKDIRPLRALPAISPIRTILISRSTRPVLSWSGT